MAGEWYYIVAVTFGRINCYYCNNSIDYKLIGNIDNYRSKFYRQTLIFSSTAVPEINAMFNKHCHSILCIIQIDLCFSKRILKFKFYGMALEFHCSWKMYNFICGLTEKIMQASFRWQNSTTGELFVRYTFNFHRYLLVM